MGRLESLIVLALAFAGALTFAGCASKPRAQGGGAPPTSSDPVEAEVITLVEAHYDALEKNDRDGFEATCSPSILRSSVPMYWTTGRRYVENYGVSWEYHHIEQVRPTRYKVFSTRYNADGSQRGSPVPCTVDNENGQWLVTTSTQ